MTSEKSTRKAEEKRAYQEATRKFGILRAKWPIAFPAKSHEVRPLAGSVLQGLVDDLGWTPAYTRIVLHVWKLRADYCHAVLRSSTRINLDGSPSEEQVSDEARLAATRSLEEIAAQRIKRAEKAELAKLRKAAREAMKEPATPAPATPTPPTVPEPKHDMLCITCFTGAPAMQEALKRLGASPAMQEALKRRLATGTIATEVVKTVPAPSSGRRRVPSSK